MKTNATQEKALRWAAHGLTLLLVLVAASEAKPEAEAKPDAASAGGADKADQAADKS